MSKLSENSATVRVFLIDDESCPRCQLYKAEILHAWMAGISSSEGGGHGGMGMSSETEQPIRDRDPL